MNTYINICTKILITLQFFCFSVVLSAQNAPDFNGDGIADLGQVWDDGGNLSVSAMLSDGFSMTENKWVNQSGNYDSTQKWFYGDFNGDGFSDAAVIWNDGGLMSSDVYLSTDTNSDFIGDTFTKTTFATQSGTFNYQDRWFIGDFNGDFQTDLARLYDDNDDRSIDVYLSTGSAFGAPTKWADQDGSFDAGNIVLTGDFDGDFDTDFAVVVVGTNVSISVHLALGNGSFGLQNWANTANPRLTSMKWVTGDFNGDGTMDIANLWNDNEKVSIDAYISTGSGFSAGSWASQSGDFDRHHKWFVGDFNGDTITDIARLWNDNGQISIESYDSTSASFVPNQIMTQGRAYKDQEDYIIGDFNGDFISDIAVTGGNASSWYVDVITYDGFASSSSNYLTASLGDFFERHSIVPKVYGDKFLNHSELFGAVPPSADLQAILDSGADLILKEREIYNVNAKLNYKADYQSIRTFDAKFISDYGILRMQKDLGDFDTMIDGNQKDFLHLENVTVDGNKFNLGPRIRPAGQGQGAMVFFSYTEGTWVKRCVFYNARVWSTVHMPESGASHSNIAENNYILGAGVDPRGNGTSLGEVVQNNNPTWSDGFSISSSKASIHNNLIMDTTDVGIVLFGAPGSHVNENIIVNYSRSNHGGINMVDETSHYLLGTDNTFGGPYSWIDYRNNLIEDNRVSAIGARIMLGIPCGNRTWKNADPSVFDFTNSIIRNNTLEGGAFGYGYVLDYVKNIEFYGNVSTAIHSGKGVGSGDNGNDPDPATAFLWDPSHVTGNVQAGFTNNTKTIESLLWHPGNPKNADGYFFYDYMDPEAEATVNASYWEMLGRMPDAAELSSGKNQFMTNNQMYGDEFKRNLMLLPEFVSRFGAIAPVNLHVFRTARWRDRVMAFDESEMINTGNFPAAGSVYDQAYADLEYNLAGANAVITSITPSLPTYMVQDQVLNVAITVQNTGSIAWANSSNNPKKFAFASVGDNTTFGATRAYIPDGVTVSNGQSYTFNLEIAAPPVAWAGEGQPLTTFFPYDFRMIQESEGYFGDSLTDHLGSTHQIEVENAPEPPPEPNYDATFVSLKLHGNPQGSGIKPGATFVAEIQMMNTSNYTTIPWSKNLSDSSFSLGSENPRDNQNWGANRIHLKDNELVYPGQIGTFVRELTAPLTEGTYDFQWRMISATPGASWHGELTPNVSINVSNSAPDLNVRHATHIASDYPEAVLQGNPFTVSLTMQNDGTSTWTPGTNYKLGEVDTFVDQISEQNGGTVTSEFSGSALDQEAESLIDNQVITKFRTDNANAWVQYQFPNSEQKEITSYAITSVADNGPGPEMLPEPGFENNGSNWDRRDSEIVVTTEDAHSGTRSLKFANISTTGSRHWRMENEPVVVGKTYDLSVWYKAPGLVGKVTFDTADEYDDVCQKNMDIPVDEWTFFTGRFTAIDTTLTIRIFANSVTAGVVYVDDVSLTEVNGASDNGDPRSWTLQGSNNGSTWTTLDSRSNIDFPNRSQKQIYSIASSASYEYYRLDATNNSGGSLQFSEFELLTDVGLWSGTGRALMAGGSSIANGGSYTFDLNLTAPMAVGDYSLRARMIKEDVAGEGWFGDLTDPITINITDVPPPFNDATFVSQTGIPSSIQPGAKFYTSITLQNSGNTNWSINDPEGGFKLSAMNPQDNTDWGSSRINTEAGVIVLPGENYTFNYIATAPALEGFYNFQWQMVQESKGRFGDFTPNVSVHVSPSAVPVPFDDATLVSQVVPTQALTNGLTEIRLTYQNAGTTTWTAAGGYQIGSENPTANNTWGADLFDMDGAASVAPGQTYEFVFNVTAPATEGTYDGQWRLNAPTRGRFGDSSNSAAINVTETPPLVKDAVFVSQSSIPASIQPGAQFNASITFQNTGNGPWSINDPEGGYKISAENPRDNVNWGFTRVNIAQGETVQPGQNYTFNFIATAPLVEGPYNFQWQMLQESKGRFGELSSNVVVNVSSGAPVNTYNDSVFVSQNIPSNVTPNETFQVRLTYTNTGTSTWTSAGGYQIGSENPNGNSNWGADLFNIDGAASVAPGQTYEFVFNVTAPAVEGAYNCQWRLHDSATGRFGENSTNQPISVSSAPVTNLVVNGSFEFGGATPTGWTLGSNSVGSTDEFQEGSSALKVTTGFGNTRQIIALQPNTDYKLSVWVLASGMTAGGIRFDTQDKFDQGQVPGGTCQFTINLGAAQTWTEYVGYFNSASETSVTIRTYKSSTFDGVAYYDNVQLVEHTNQAPVWDNNPLTKSNATVDTPYVGSLSGNVDDLEEDSLTFTKTGGPAWLTVASDGTLGGTPIAGSGGLNIFTVTASDGRNPAVEVTVNITVDGDGVTDPGGDDDGDGISNLLEEALGGDRLSADDPAVILPTATKNGTNIRFSFNRADAGMTYDVEKSTDLQTWTLHERDPGVAGAVVNVDVPDTEMNNGKLFLRLSVAE